MMNLQIAPNEQLEAARLTERPLKMLLILHMPWSRDMGGPRVSVELADEFRALGVEVDKYDINDAFPKHTKLSSYFEYALFAKRAMAFVKRHGHKYDVIQAEQGNLPCSKKGLRFKGVLVAHSSGLVHLHEQRAREAARTRRSANHQGRLPGNVLRWTAKRIFNASRAVEHSFAAADAIFLLNQDEMRFVDHHLGYGSKSHSMTNGLSEERFAQFAAHAVSPETRLAQQRIVFIGAWCELKGSEDFPRLVRQVRAEMPHTQFLFLGTGGPEERILKAFDAQDREAIKVVPSFRSSELPDLLSTSTIGVFPSYMEGFGIGVLEKLAAGIPTITYDVPGPREMLQYFPQGMMVTSGDVATLASRLVEVLRSSVGDYINLSDQAKHVADRFRTRKIAHDVLTIYSDECERNKSN